jgi:hypothetical protein
LRLGGGRVTESAHGGFFDDVGVDGAVAEHPLGEEPEDHSCDDEAGDLFARAFLDLLELAIVHAEVVVAA